MKKISVLAMTVALALGACGGKGSDKLDKLKDEACACKDKACAEEVNKKMDSAMEDLVKEFDGKEPDEATQKKIAGSMMEAGLCLSKHLK
jgi:hypothetical protein